MLYFAYGSNLHPARLGARLARPALVGRGVVAGRTLAFRKRGSDGSAKADAPRGPGRLHGALYALDPSDAARLDRHERGYRRAALAVATARGRIEAFTYLALPALVDEALRPFAWYRRLVLAGAAFHGFPAGYLAALAAVEPARDPDPRRAARELRVLEPGRRPGPR